ncbi:MAG: hypothetical protein MJK12_03895 [Colwellia sp.]|nr:hypothetical protein [Colwellia sp.]
MIRFLSCIILVCALTACAVIKDEPLRKTNYVEEVGNQKIYVIEFNDDGDLHLEEQRLRLLTDIAKGLTETNLVFFVHGWHHNASIKDGNYLGFKNFLGYLNQGKEKYTGVYIGWRGDQNDPLWIDGTIEAIDFLTLRERKEVSIVVGENGIRNLLDDLDKSVLSGDINKSVLIGHSLGGSAVFHASKNRLNIEDDNFYILLNPALTDKEYRPFYLDQSKKPKDPKMVILQSKTDSSINFFFDLVNVGEDSVGNSWAISHDLDSCNDCKISDSADECKILINNKTWKLTARKDNGPQRETCEETNMLNNWVVAVDGNAIDKHNGILELNQAEALVELLINREKSRNKDNLLTSQRSRAQ